MNNFIRIPRNSISVHQYTIKEGSENRLIYNDEIVICLDGVEFEHTVYDAKDFNYGFDRLLVYTKSRVLTFYDNPDVKTRLTTKKLYEMLIKKIGIKLEDVA